MNISIYTEKAFNKIHSFLINTLLKIERNSPTDKECLQNTTGDGTCNGKRI